MYMSRINVRGVDIVYDDANRGVRNTRGGGNALSLTRKRSNTSAMRERQSPSSKLVHSHRWTLRLIRQH